MNICADILSNIDTDPGLLDTVILKGTRFESVEAVKAKATKVLNQLTEADFQHCSQQWKSRMERCRDRQVEYIEGEEVATWCTKTATVYLRQCLAAKLVPKLVTDRPTEERPATQHDATQLLSICE
ncbi:hypothetical protein NQ318_014359 [Aromia moschata]|uniref:Uncharacterized protein n=1 Tax=Aromia moschata TaxID=1265417 RepID=A0AAV8Z028_9CUCU|nr:hypothetical protein NQ318_014359 [Aromia moschata]